MGSCIYLLFALSTLLLQIHAAPTSHEVPVVHATDGDALVSKPADPSTLQSVAVRGTQSSATEESSSSEPPASSSVQPPKETISDAPLYSSEVKSEEPEQPEVAKEDVKELEEIPKGDQGQVKPDSLEETKVSSLSPESEPTTLRQREVDVMDATTAISVKYVQGIPSQPIPLPDHLAVADPSKASYSSSGGQRHGSFRFASFEPFFQMSETGQLGILFDSEGALARRVRDSRF